MARTIGHEKIIGRSFTLCSFGCGCWQTFTLKPEHHWLLWFALDLVEPDRNPESTTGRPAPVDLRSYLLPEKLNVISALEQVARGARGHHVFQRIQVGAQHAPGCNHLASAVPLALVDGLADNGVEVVSMPALFWQRDSAVPTEAA
jgi:hypothetical protein